MQVRRTHKFTAQLRATLEAHGQLEEYAENRERSQLYLLTDEAIASGMRFKQEL